MDRELKAPFVPPKGKMIGEKEVQQMVQLAKPITKEINVVTKFIYFRGGSFLNLQKR